MGSVVRLTAQFFQAGSGSQSTTLTPADPTQVIFYVNDPNGQVHQSSVDLGPVVKDDIGVYHLDVQVTTYGNWEWQAVGSGAIVANNYGQIFVRTPEFFPDGECAQTSN